MYTVVDVTSDINLWFNKDPVRPELTPEFRQAHGRYVFALMDEEPSAKAFCCFALCNQVPKNIKELDRFTISKSTRASVAVPYSVWRYEKGGGYKILNHLIPIFKNRFKVSRIVTLSPATSMAKKFHLRNGATIDFSSDNFVNYRYL